MRVIARSGHFIASMINDSSGLNKAPAKSSRNNERTQAARAPIYAGVSLNQNSFKVGQERAAPTGLGSNERRGNR
jgi:hypothetical protein